MVPGPGLGTYQIHLRTVEIPDIHLLAYVTRRVNNTIWDKKDFLEAKQTVEGSGYEGEEAHGSDACRAQCD